TVAFDPGSDFDDLAPGATQQVEITYTISDGQGGTDTATATVTVTGTNDGPMAADDTAETTENASVDIDVLGNDSDVDGGTLSVTDASVADGEGSVPINQDGTVSFDPGSDFDDLAPGATQQVEITYTISDGQGGTDMATATVTVTGTNDGPVAADDSLSGDENQAIDFTAQDLLGNDSDVDGGSLSITDFDQPDGGTLVQNGDGSFTFTPDQDFTGETSFTYTVSDGQGGTDTATVTIDVEGVVQQADLTVTDSAGDEDTAIALDIDVSSEDDIASIVIDGVPDGAQLSAGTDNGDGTWTLEEGDLANLTVTPPADSNADFSLDVTITTEQDGETAQVTGTIDVDVAGVADAPD
ncbi:MAG: tandem-95 repeat protein, partial [Proteobacteria bacterium]|nr:tandem-95 repeat protein [Pseudomonadota bacterium]